MPSAPRFETSPSPDRQPARRDAPAWTIAAVPERCDLPTAEAFCRAIASRHYENFTVATRLVPQRLRQHLANVYAFARWSDDLADELAGPEESLAALAMWRERLGRCFAGQPDHPVFIALAETIRVAGLDQKPFADLIDAFEQDQHVFRYPNRHAVLAYCSRSADPVGRIVLALEGCRDTGLLRLSDSICSGLQLVNFWQDVKRDRAAGRVYLPAEDMLRHRVDESMLDADAATPELVRLLYEEVEWARDCLRAGLPLEHKAPPALRPAIGMFIRGGLAIADGIERIGYDTLARRPLVSRWTKARLAARAWWGMVTHTRQTA